MRPIAPEVFHLPLAPRDAMNAYLVGDVLVDTGVKQSAGSILKALRGRDVRAIALTHAHVDHAGSARRLATELGVPVWAPRADREATETGHAVTKAALSRPGLVNIASAVGDFPGVPVAQDLDEGDELGAGFVVLNTPGHSPGHLSLWRERDRVLICGDVFFNMHVLTTVPGLREPPRLFTVDPPLNRSSERKVAALEPDVAAFGHGPVVEHGAGPQLATLVAALPA